MSRALIVESELTTSPLVREALADAGCVELEAMSFDDVLATLPTRSPGPDVIVVHVEAAQLGHLQRLARIDRALPVVAICDEGHVDDVHRSGAAESATTPVRTRELVGRIRCALRGRREARRLSETIVTLRREKHDLERLVCVDALTGIANRRHALSLLAAEWRRSSRDHLPLGLVMIDLDCYHAYNEQYGHLGGDRCLQLVCEAMVKCLRRPSDYLGRYGGEEFVAVLPNTDAIGAKLVAERLRASVEELGIPHVASRCAHVVTITAGFASLRVTPDLSMDRLIAVADAALLRAKAMGRNRVDGDAPLVRPSRTPAHAWQRFDPVIADPWFADRIPAFLAEVHASARELAHALRRDELRQIGRSAAKLRTGACALCLPEVERLARDLEHAAASADAAAARHAVEDLVEYVTHVQVIYRRTAAPAPTRACT